MLMILQKMLDVDDFKENVWFSRKCSMLMILKKMLDVDGLKENVWFSRQCSRLMILKKTDVDDFAKKARC